MTSPRGGLTSSHGTSTAGDWWERAACRNADPDAFTPPPDEYRIMTTTEAAYARTYCARCPVKAECFSDALAHGDDYGIRGGIDMASRNKRRRASQAANAPAPAPDKVEPAEKRRKPWPSDEAAARRAADHARAHRRRQEGTEPPCGTRAGYDHHRAIGEPYCDPCRNYRRNESQTERDRRAQAATQAADLTPRARLGAERAARAAEARAQLAAQIEDLVQVGADLHYAARATSKTIGALEKALQRAQRHDLIAKLKRAA